MNRLFTAGYGNDAPDKFLERLKDAGIDQVIDVRKTGGAWSGCYKAYKGKIHSKGISRWLFRHCQIRYTWFPELGKPKEMPLSQYETSVLDSAEGKKSLQIAQYWIHERNVPCLLCCEREAYKDGEVNCHRAHVADALAKQLGDDWEVVHL